MSSSHSSFHEGSDAAGQLLLIVITASQTWCPRQDSNLRSRPAGRCFACPPRRADTPAARRRSLCVQNEARVERPGNQARALVDWLVAVRLVPPHVAVSVLPSQLEALRDLRELTHRLVRATMAGAEFDDMARSTRWRCSLTWLPNCRWTATRELTWGERDPVDAALATLARDAVGLLIGADVADKGVRTPRLLVAVRRRLSGRPTVLVLDGRCGPGCLR
jgi:hypothetical protein